MDRPAGAASTAVVVDPGLFTLIIQFRVDPRVGEVFVHELTEAVSRSIVRLEGFRTSVFQLSGDHGHVVNYAQWDSQEVYERSMAGRDPDEDPVGDVVARHGARVVMADPFSIVATFAAGEDA